MSNPNSFAVSLKLYVNPSIDLTFDSASVIGEMLVFNLSSDANAIISLFTVKMPVLILNLSPVLLSSFLVLSAKTTYLSLPLPSVKFSTVASSNVAPPST